MCQQEDPDSYVLHQQLHKEAFSRYFTLNHEEVKALLRELEREYITEENSLAKHVVRRMQIFDREQHFNKI